MITWLGTVPHIKSCETIPFFVELNTAASSATKMDSHIVMKRRRNYIRRAVTQLIKCQLLLKCIHTSDVKLDSSKRVGTISRW